MLLHFGPVGSDVVFTASPTKRGPDLPRQLGAKDRDLALVMESGSNLTSLASKQVDHGVIRWGRHHQQPKVEKSPKGG
jgi:hypothetical protein